mmetsp:Transcript_7592/g.11333  ORF Transcript_7592/g.11333 Transcript_7592/m.11333 type:complete len:150 (+) Transcript_7592:604-1053(+)
MPVTLNLLILIVAIFGSLLTNSNAFGGFESYARNRSQLRMMFGGGAKAAAKKVSISVDGKVIESDEKAVNLRKELMKNNIDVYPLRAKITGNCGGAGICGTCAVKVLSGAENLNPASKNEQNTLKGKPADWRLSCCARVSGPISIKTKP